ncbi:MAG: beta-propeller fold lactonase family protein, partial [Acidobacteriota bacterium]|nr:beta-propeller fold lactonase family protein [Acidobacteriota bacterium]
MRIYSAPNVSAFTGGGGKIDTYINLQPGTYNTVVQAWDYCGNVGKSYITITVTAVTKPAGFVYALNSYFNADKTNSNVHGFTIVGSNGALASTLQGPVSANIEPAAIAADKGGYRLYVADYVSGDVFPYFINSRNGYLSTVPGSPFPAHRSVAAVAVHPSGALVFAALSQYATGDGVAVFQVQSNGSLKEAPGSPYPVQSGPQTLSVDPSGNYLYVGSGSGYVEAFQINTVSAALTPLPGSPYKVSSQACGSAYPRDVINFLGKYLYVGDGTSGEIDGYGVTGAGTLSGLAGSPWVDTRCEGAAIDDPLFSYSPRSMTIDGTGKFLYALNMWEANIAIYAIQPNGALKFLKFAAQNSAC